MTKYDIIHECVQEQYDMGIISYETAEYLDAKSYLAYTIEKAGFGGDEKVKDDVAAISKEPEETNNLKKMISNKKKLIVASIALLTAISAALVVAEKKYKKDHPDEDPKNLMHDKAMKLIDDAKAHLKEVQAKLKAINPLDKDVDKAVKEAEDTLNDSFDSAYKITLAMFPEGAPEDVLKELTKQIDTLKKQNREN